MSDPIGNIIWGEDYFSNPHDDEIIKQIRQRIGRELLDEFKTRLRLKTYVPENIVREVCQLEEE